MPNTLVMNNNIYAPTLVLKADPPSLPIFDG